MTSSYPEVIRDERALNGYLTTPSPALIAMMANLKGDIIILGIAGKMGQTLGVMARRAIEASGVSRTVYGVSRFSDPSSRNYLEAAGVRTIPCDLLDREALVRLPQADNVIYMVGRKFGTRGTEALTWATNVSVPDFVSYHYRHSRIVVFSTGCVYPLVSVSSGGCTEDTAPDPVGEYAQSCLGRERVFGHWSHTWGTPLCLMRLNYAIDLRYGVLYDIAARVYAGKPVDLSVSHFNVIWQGDANGWALHCLDACASPPRVLNVTGPETVSVRFVAETFASLFGTTVTFTGQETGAHMYLSNAAQAFELFGYPSVSLMSMIKWQAAWIQRGGRALDKPTHFGVVDGEF